MTFDQDVLVVTSIAEVDDIAFFSALEAAGAYDEERAMVRLAAAYPTVSRDRVPMLEASCAELNRRFPRWHWCVEQSQFDVPDDQALFAIFVWGPME